MKDHENISKNPSPAKRSSSLELEPERIREWARAIATHQMQTYQLGSFQLQIASPIAPYTESRNVSPLIISPNSRTASVDAQAPPPFIPATPMSWLLSSGWSLHVTGGHQGPETYRLASKATVWGVEGRHRMQPH